MSTTTEIKPHSADWPRDSRIFIYQNLESDKQTQRRNLRHTLSQTLTQHSLSTSPSLLDLLSLPLHAELSLSLSHCATYSAFAWCSLPQKIGLDVEDVQKIKPSTVARVSSPTERDSAPRLDLLWSCKESVFKAVFPRAKALSFVEIFDWKLLRDETWSFRAREGSSQVDLRGQGEVRLILGHSLAFFIFFS